MARSEEAWKAVAAATEASADAASLVDELALASPKAQAAAEAVRKAEREDCVSDHEVRQQRALAAQEAMLEEMRC